MKHFRPVAFTILLAAMIAPARAAEPTTKPDLAEENAKLKEMLKISSAEAVKADYENQELKKQNEKLKAENNKLKAELFANGRKLDQPIKPAPFGLNVPPSTTPQQPPGSDWRMFEYNSRNVYVVPLKQTIDHIDDAVRDYRLHKKGDLDLIDDRPAARK